MSNGTYKIIGPTYTVQVFEKDDDTTSQEVITSTAGQTVINVGGSPNNVLVVLNGVVQDPTNYTYVSGVLTFNDPLLDGDSLYIIKLP